MILMYLDGVRKYRANSCYSKKALHVDYITAILFDISFTTKK